MKGFTRGAAASGGRRAGKDRAEAAAEAEEGKGGALNGKSDPFYIENTLLCPEVPAVQRFAALRLHGEPLFTETTAREAVRQAELWTARQILHELETGT